MKLFHRWPSVKDLPIAAWRLTVHHAKPFFSPKKKKAHLEWVEAHKHSSLMNPNWIISGWMGITFVGSWGKSSMRDTVRSWFGAASQPRACAKFATSRAIWTPNCMSRSLIMMSRVLAGPGHQQEEHLIPARPCSQSNDRFPQMILDFPRASSHWDWSPTAAVTGFLTSKRPVHWEELHRDWQVVGMGRLNIQISTFLSGMDIFNSRRLISSGQCVQ